MCNEEMFGLDACRLVAVMAAWVTLSFYDCERYVKCDSCWGQGRDLIAVPPSSFR